MTHSRRLKNKVAIVTGASNGIGLKTAELFANEGASVIAVDILPPNEELMHKYKAYTTTAASIDHLQLDVSKEKNWAKIIDHVKSKYKKLNILVNNAGINGYEYLQDPEHMTLDTWDQIHAINLGSVFLGCKYAISLMKDALKNDASIQNEQHEEKKNLGPSSSIINIASRSGIVGVPNLAAYGSTKAAIRNYTKSVAAYCAQKSYNIRCNTISPASINTRMFDNLKANKQAFDTFCKNIPLQRIGRPEEVAHACLYLASSEASYTTGSEIIIDGGILTTCGSLPK